MLCCKIFYHQPLESPRRWGSCQTLGNWLHAYPGPWPGTVVNQIWQSPPIWPHTSPQKGLYLPPPHLQYHSSQFCCTGGYFCHTQCQLDIGILIWVLFILEVGLKCFLFITDKEFWIIKTVLRLMWSSPLQTISDGFWTSIWVGPFPLTTLGHFIMNLIWISSKICAPTGNYRGLLTGSAPFWSQGTEGWWFIASELLINFGSVVDIWCRGVGIFIKF